MKRKVFYSFHYQKDVWRVAQIRNIGAIEGNEIAKSNDWEEVKRQGDQAIKRWINHNLENRSCLVVLIGEETSERRYVLYEIEQAWNRGMGVLGIYIHNIKDRDGQTSKKGKNPFDKFRFLDQFSRLDIPAICPNQLMKCNSKDITTYNIICTNLADWIEQAIEYRKNKGSISRK